MGPGRGPLAMLLLAAACGFDSGGVMGSATLGVASDTEDSGTTADPTATTSTPTSADPTSATATGGESGSTVGIDTGDETAADTSATTSADTGCEPAVFHVDADADGYGDPTMPVRACDMPAGTVADATDCNDQDPAAHPGADEVCNGIDDDCDTALDEWSPMNPTCAGCLTAPVGTDVFYACPGAVAWDTARADCQLKGAEIATIAAADENAIAYGLAASLVANDVWIGLRREDYGAAFQWQDGTPLGYTNWRPGAPDTAVQVACGELDTLDAGQWNDAACSDAATTAAWLCRGPQ